MVLLENRHQSPRERWTTYILGRTVSNLDTLHLYNKNKNIMVMRMVVLLAPYVHYLARWKY